MNAPKMQLQQAIDCTDDMLKAGAGLSAAYDRSRQSAAHMTGLSVYLKGHLGMGKTVFSRGVIQSFGVAGPILSPTYALILSYQLPSQMLYHIDLYRMDTIASLECIGFWECMLPEHLCLVEWPDRFAEHQLPVPDMLIEFKSGASADQRQLCYTAYSEAAVQCLSYIQSDHAHA